MSGAALVAVAAVLSGDFSDTDGRLILTSIGFALCTSAAAVGASLRLRSEEWLQLLGTVTAALSAATLVLLLVGLWTGDWGERRGLAGVRMRRARHDRLPARLRCPGREDPLAKATAVSLILLTLTSLLPALLRRLRDARPPKGANAHLAVEVEAIADRIEELTAGPGLRTPEIRREAARLCDLARSFQA